LEAKATLDEPAGPRQECGAVQHAVGLGVNRIVVGADGVAGTQPGALEGGFDG